MKKLTFKNGDSMPLLGLGTWKSEPGEVAQAVRWALEAGYRHIDCAAIYGNEREVGRAFDKAFKEGMVRREELFVTSKLWNSSHRLEDVLPAIRQTLRNLRLDYLDLYLVHWPISFKPGVGYAQTREEYYTYGDVPLPQTWEGMEQCKEKGLARHIGVSNFNIAKLDEIFKNAEVMPEMNQVELHPFLPQNKLVDFCKSHDIHVTAYSPLGSGDRSRSVREADEPSLLGNALISALAEKYHVSPAQILIAYSICREIAVIPKSVNRDRIFQNFGANDIELSEEDMRGLARIGVRHRFIDGSFFTGSKSPYKLSDLWEADET